MIKLIRLELKKTKLTGYVFTAIFITLFTSISSCILPYLEAMEQDSNIFLDYTSAFFVIKVMTGTLFIIFAAVLTSKIVVEEYKNKTIYLMFSYPINRKKLMIAKMLLIIIWTFVTVISSTLFTTAVFLISDHFLQIIPETLTADMIKKQLVDIVYHAIISACLSLIPFFFGMLKKSVPTTILSSVILMSVLNLQIADFSLGMIRMVTFSLAIIAIFLTYFILNGIEQKDI